MQMHILTLLMQRALHYYMLSDELLEIVGKELATDCAKNNHIKNVRHIKNGGHREH